jgi:hypothetical protein
LIGAARGSKKLPGEPDGVGAIYWWSVLGLSILTAAIASGGPNGELAAIPIDAIAIIVLGMPGIQLTASLITAVAVAILPFENKAGAIRRVVRITGWSIIGTLIGIGIMLGILVLATGGNL